MSEPTADLVARLRAALEGITPGTWTHYSGSHCIWSDREAPPSQAVCVLSGPRSWNGQSRRDAERERNGAFIAAAPELLRDAADALEAMQRTARVVGDLLEEYADQRTKEAYDTCEDCGPMFMCRFHSLLSALEGETWTNPALERDHLRREVKALQQERDTLREENGVLKRSLEMLVRQGPG